MSSFFVSTAMVTLCRPMAEGAYFPASRMASSFSRSTGQGS